MQEDDRLSIDSDAEPEREHTPPLSPHEGLALAESHAADHGVSLTENWDRAGTTGRGVEMVLNRQEPDIDDRAFCVDRITRPPKQMRRTRRTLCSARAASRPHRGWPAARSSGTTGKASALRGVARGRVSRALGRVPQALAIAEGGEFDRNQRWRRHGGSEAPVTSRHRTCC